MSRLAACGLAAALALAACTAPGTNPPAAPKAESRDWRLEPGREIPVETRLPSGALARFLLFVPAGTDGTKPLPLLIFLHGSGESGTDLERVKVNGPPRIVESRPDFPFLVISPQSPTEEGFDIALLEELLADARRHLPVDPDRVYLTGLSMGGFGTWAWAQAHPEHFAAIAPISGLGNVAQACQLRNLPIWAFHGALDDVVPIAGDQALIAAIRACGGQPRFTVYGETGHDAWTETYDDTRIYTWLLAQSRGAAHPAGKPK